MAEWSIQLPYRDRDAKLNLAEIADDVGVDHRSRGASRGPRTRDGTGPRPRRSDVRRCAREARRPGSGGSPGAARPGPRGRRVAEDRRVAARRSAAMRGAGTPPETARSGWFDPPRGLRGRAPVGGGEDRGFVVATKNKSRAQCQRPIRGEMGRWPLCALDEGHRSSP